MGFYGNITNTSRTQFQFDKIYPSRTDMDAAASSDGIYSGRYVLVNYEEENYLDHFPLAYKVLVDNEIKFYRTYNEETEEGEEYIFTPDASPDADKLKQNTFIRVPIARNLRDPNTDRDEFWKVTGSYTVEYEGTDGTIKTKQCCLYTQYTDSFAVYYNKDVENYGTSRGYDSTVWQKVYQDGTDKYVMVAELNTVVPTFDLEPDAPKMVPLQPHFDASSTNVYYKLHWAPNWGFRIKAADPSLIGPELMTNGMPGSSNNKMSSDTTKYLSDEKTTWHNIVSVNGKDTDYVFAVYKPDPHAEEGTPTAGVWRPATSGMFADELSDVEELPAAIYYNKEGFDPKYISYGFVPVTLTADTYKPGKYYCLNDRIYELCEELYWSNEKEYYSKIEDHIALQPTGYSGHSYNAHDGGVTRTLQVDTQEMSIILPSIGNMVAACWDLIYGNANVNDGNKRNLDVTWETARGGLARNGLRLITDFNLEAGQYAYKTKNVETVAGALNSMHDLMGMIITAAPEADLTDSSIIEDLDINRIYYDVDRKRFYRKRQGYAYSENAFNGYSYKQLSIDADTYVPHTYYYRDNNEWVVDDSDEYTEGRVYYGRYIPATNEYIQHNINEFTNFDGTKYCYADYTELVDSTTSMEYKDYVKDPKYQSDKTYYYWNDEVCAAGSYEYPNGETNNASMTVRGITYYAQPIDLQDEYMPNTYHYQVSDGYAIDKGKTADPTRVYYKFIMRNARTLKDLGYDNIYMPGKYLYPLQSQYVKISVADQEAFNTLILNHKELYYYQNDTPMRAMTYQGPVQYYELVPSGYAVDTHPVMNTDDNGQPVNARPYYLLNTDNQRIIDDKVYDKVIIYKLYNLTSDNYVSGVYYYWSSQVPEPVNKDDGSYNDDNYYTLDTSGTFNSNIKYYMRVETLTLVQTSYYVVDENNPLSLIQYNSDEFYTYDELTGKLTVVNNLTDLTQLDLSKTYVLRNALNANGNHKLSYEDFSNPAVTALLRQSGVYYTPNTYHYMTELELDNSGNPVLDNQGHGIPTSYSDLMLDDYPTKQKTNYYKIVIPNNEPLLPISSNIKFFEGYKYYQYNEATDEYTLITSDIKPTGIQYVYERNAYYVTKDEANVYPVGAHWNLNTELVPPSVTLKTRTDTWELVEIPDFARNMNTMHGLLLKINQMLEMGNEQTRDLRTVQGALNALNDKISMFGKWKTGQLVLIDDFGRLQSAEEIPNSWIEIVTDTNVVNSKVGIRHKYNPIADTTSTADLSTDNAATLTDISPNIDAMGHVVSSETKTYSLPHGYGVLEGDSGSVAAGGTYATMKFEGSDDWIQTAAATESDVKKIKITHTGPVLTGATARGETAAQTPNYGDTFVVPSFSVDSKGHIAASADHTVTIPSLGLSSSTSGNVVVGLTYDNAGIFTKTLSDLALITLDSYGTATTNINASMTLGAGLSALDGAIDSLDSRLDTLEGYDLNTRLSALEADTLDSRLDILEGYDLDTRVSTLEGYDLDTRVTSLEDNVADLKDGTVNIVYGQEEPEPGEETGADKTMSAVEMAQNIETLQGAVNALTTALNGKMDTPLTYTIYHTEYSYEVADPQPVDPDPDPFDPTDLYVEDENDPGNYIPATVYDSTITYYVQVSEQVSDVHTITIDEIVQRLVALENA